MRLPVFLVLLLGATPAYAKDPRIPHEKYVLENGLEVILVPDSKVPLVEVNLWYHVGSGDETRGKTGFAHLFEHMMFQGSAHTEEDAHFKTLEKIGASGVNGTTSEERTNYFETVPAHQVETALWLESDRMGFLLPGVDEKSLDNQRLVVRNERRQSLEIQPYGQEYVEMYKALYPEGHPYRHMVIGKHEDIQGATVADVKAFFRTWYVPSNATLCLAGDFESAAMKQLVDKWFGDFPKAPKPKHRDVAPPAPRRDRITVQDPYAKLRRVRYVWHTPKLYAPGDAELDILSHALGEEGTGRLFRTLVLKKQLAHSVTVFQQSGQLSSMFYVQVDLKTGAEMGEVEKLVQEELARVMKEPISKRELDRAVTNFESDYVWRLEGLHARCETLQLYNHHTGNPDGITWDLDRYRKATAEGIRDVAARLLGKAGRIEIVTMPKEGKK